MQRMLKDISTKELLRMRDAAYVDPGAKVVSVSRGRRGESRAYRNAFRAFTPDEAAAYRSAHPGAVLSEEGFTLQEILAELGTREHVPNKQEARAIRQARARSRA